MTMATTTRRLPKQKRSREHVERMLAATADVIAELGIEGLTMSAVAERADVSSATVYRYFTDRDELAAAFFDEQMQKINLAVGQAFLSLKVVTVRSIVETSMLAHLHHHQAHPEIAKAWFHTPRAKVVHEHIKKQDERMGEWLREVLRATGLLSEDTPPIGEGLLIDLGDCTFEWIFSRDLSKDDQDAIVAQFNDMVASYLERFATPAGLKGISNEEFVAAISNIAQQSDS